MKHENDDTRLPVGSSSESEAALAQIARDQAVARLCNRLESILHAVEPIIEAIIEAAVAEERAKAKKAGR